MERDPVVAAQFYDYRVDELKKQIEDCFLKKRFGPEKLPTVNEKGKRKILGLVVPHAGYIYSGPIAANSYFHLASDGRPDIFIVIGPNHSGFGSPVSIMDEGTWKMPFGRVEIDTETAKEIIKNSRMVKKDASAH
ncbi:MAG: AmmeMemoRadiSam system protein B, partial [Candidatus Aenigmatarchaeota archaeon]